MDSLATTDLQVIRLRCLLKRWKDATIVEMKAVHGHKMISDVQAKIGDRENKTVHNCTCHHETSKTNCNFISICDADEK